MSRAPLSSQTFAVAGTLSLVVAVILMVLGSFAFFHVASLGTIFIAAATVLGVIHQAFPRAAAALSVTGIGLVVIGLVVMPLTFAGVAFAGWGLIAASAVLSLRVRLRSTG